MSNYIEYNDIVAFHPGYYIEEIVKSSGLTQNDFAKRLDTTPKNLSLLIRGEQDLSIDMAMKLSRMVGTSVQYWLNLQNAFDTLIIKFKSDEELKNELKVFKALNYKYFKENYGLKDLSHKRDEQVIQVRNFLGVSTLSVFTRKDMAVNFRCSSKVITEENTIRANIMVQIAINEALKVKAPKFNKKIFENTIEYALTLTENHDNFYSKLKEAFFKAGVIFIILPNLPGSKINGATKKIGNNVMLMVNDRRLNMDSFWFTLFHEIGHIINGDFGISFEKDIGEQEEGADRYAENCLISPERYSEFIKKGNFDLKSIQIFAKQIKREPGIVLGRLQNDGLIKYNDWRMNSLRHKYKVEINI